MTLPHKHLAGVARHEVNILPRSLPRTIRQMSHAASQALAQNPIFLYSKERGRCKHQIQDIFHLPRKSPTCPAPQAARGIACGEGASILSRIETSTMGMPPTRRLSSGEGASILSRIDTAV